MAGASRHDAWQAGAHYEAYMGRWSRQIAPRFLDWFEVETVFRDFEDYWRPFTLGGGPAPGYCASLAPEARQRLKDRLEGSLPRREDGAIHLKARAWAVQTSVQ